MEVTFKVEATSKKTKVVSLIKESILSGGLQPGEGIVESRMAQQFGVGVGLIREALLDLEHDGFVQRTPFSKTQVTTLGRKDAQQIFDLRILLEPVACELAGSHASPQQLRELASVSAQARTAIERDDLTAFFGRQLEFRRKIWEFAQNKYLQQILERLVVPLYALYLIRESSNRAGLVEVAWEGSRHQQTVVDHLVNGRVAEAVQETAGFLVRMKGNLGTKLLP